MKLQNIEAAEAALQPYVPLVAQLTGSDTTLERIAPLMELLGNPQQQIRTVHIAGTSGKTSTAYYMAALLQAAGQKVGLTVSPHVDSITERVQLNGEPISDELFCAELGEFLDVIQSSPQQPSYFELLYAFAIWVFARHKVEYAVVETGLGGLHDATNVASQANKVCIITDIGYDHMNILGQTLPEIAAQKIGIVHPGNIVFSYRQAPEVMRVFENWAKQQQARLEIVVAGQVSDQLSWRGIADYQRRNWVLAKQVFDYLAARDSLQHLTSKVLQNTLLVQVPGRMDVRQVGDKIVVMDGAHNQQKITAFVDSFRHLYPDNKPAVLIALKEGKEYQAVVPLIAALGGRIIITSFQTSQDVPIRSLDPELLAESFRDSGAASVSCLPDNQQALRSLLTGPEKICVITGSFYLLGQLRHNKQLQA